MAHNPGFLKLVEQVKSRIQECTIQDVKANMDRGEQFHFLDVREDHEFAKDYAKGTIHLGRGILERSMENSFDVNFLSIKWIFENTKGEV